MYIELDVVYFVLSILGVVVLGYLATPLPTVPGLTEHAVWSAHTSQTNSTLGIKHA